MRLTQTEGAPDKIRGIVGSGCQGCDVGGQGLWEPRGEADLGSQRRPS